MVDEINFNLILIITKYGLHLTTQQFTWDSILAPKQHTNSNTICSYVHTSYITHAHTANISI